MIIIHSGTPLYLDTLRQELDDEQLRSISIMKVYSSAQLKQNCNAIFQKQKEVSAALIVFDYIYEFQKSDGKWFDQTIGQLGLVSSVVLFGSLVDARNADALDSYMYTNQKLGDGEYVNFTIN